MRVNIRNNFATFALKLKVGAKILFFFHLNNFYDMKSEFQQEIITSLKEYRLKEGYTQQEVGVLLGISNGQVGNIESPKMPHKYTLSQISMLCDAFQIDIERIFLNELELMDNDNKIKSLIKKIIEYEN